MYGLYTDETIDLLQECSSIYDSPVHPLLNHGMKLYAVKGGNCDFDRFCETFNVHHIQNSITHPGMLRKTERLHNMHKNYPDWILQDPSLASWDNIGVL